MERSLGTRIAFVAIGLSAFAFGISTGSAHGWELDIINTITIGAAIALILAGIFVKPSESKGKRVQSGHL